MQRVVLCVVWQHVAQETENLNTEFKNVQQDAEIQY
jgi:hypothetical protein